MRKPKHIKSPPHRWGDGKVHLLIKASGGFYKACEGITKTTPYHRGEETTDPITCKRCLKG